MKIGDRCFVSGYIDEIRKDTVIVRNSGGYFGTSPGEVITVYNTAHPNWIPCSERLPEEEGWYITTIENEKTGRRRIENDLFAIGIAEAHGNTPYKFCKDGYRQKTIAWMPLPEPYAERRTDG